MAIASFHCPCRNDARRKGSCLSDARNGRDTVVRGAISPWASANHRDYHRYLRGETDRPATTLADSRPFVHLNNLAYVSSAEITRLPERLITRNATADSQDHFLEVQGLDQALDDFVTQGLWPSLSRGWRATPPCPTSLVDLARFHMTIAKLAATGCRTASIPMI